MPTAASGIPVSPVVPHALRDENDPYFALKDGSSIRAYYEANGYVVIRKVIPASLCDEIQSMFDWEVRTYEGLLYRFTAPTLEGHRWTEHGLLTNPLLNLQSQPGALEAYKTRALNVLTHDGVQQGAEILLGERPKLVQSCTLKRTKTPRPIRTPTIWTSRR